MAAIGKCAAGSSPHTRGALRPERHGLAGVGIIPAYAGSTRKYQQDKAWQSDHPRIRGEHFDCVGCYLDDVGIIPAYAGSTAAGYPKP